MWEDIDKYDSILDKLEVDDRQLIKEKIGVNKQLYDVMFENKAYAVLFIDTNRNTFIDCNDKAIEILKAKSKTHIINMLPSQISPKYQPDGKTSEEKQHKMIKMALEKGWNVFDWMIIQTDGCELWIEVTLVKISLNSRDILLVNWKDINYRKEEEIRIKKEVEDKTIELKIANEKLSNIAFYDQLTSLPNRYYFKDHFEYIFNQAKRENKKIALIFIDLDDFKLINDNISHSAGDKVLAIISNRYKSVLRINDFVARIGGDEFCMAIYDFNEIDELEVIAKRIIKESNEPINVPGKKVSINASVGIAIYPENGSNFDELLTSADSAMYKIKKKEKGFYAFSTYFVKSPN